MKRAVKNVLGLGLAISIAVTGSLSVLAAGLRDIFNAKYYADSNPDVKEAFGYDEESLYQHYLTFGLSEGRSASPVFDVVAYREMYGDLDEAFGDNWDAYVEHYFTYGVEEHRVSGGTFDPIAYAEAYPDVKEAFGDDYEAIIEHFLNFGIAEGRTAGVTVETEPEPAPAPAPSPSPSAEPEEEEVGSTYMVIRTGTETYGKTPESDLFTGANIEWDGMTGTITRTFNKIDEWNHGDGEHDITGTLGSGHFIVVEFTAAAQVEGNALKLEGYKAGERNYSSATAEEAYWVLRIDQDEKMNENKEFKFTFGPDKKVITLKIGSVTLN